MIVLAAGWWTFTASRPASDTGSLLTDAHGQRADLSALPADLRSGVENALREGHLNIAPPTPELHPRPGVLAGSAAPALTGFQVLGPVGVKTKDVRPTLRWTPCPGGMGYVVTLVSQDGADTRTSPELPAAQTSWTPPEPLVSGAVYAWQVEALAGAETLAHAPAPPTAEARFQILSEAARAELARVEARFGTFPLVMAVAYARAGLEQDAAGELAKLAREHPSSAAERLLRQSVLH